MSQVGDHDQDSAVLGDAQAQGSAGGVTVLIEQVIQSGQRLDGLLILVVGVVQVDESSLGDVDVLDLLTALGDSQQILKQAVIAAANQDALFVVPDALVELVDLHGVSFLEHIVAVIVGVEGIELTSLQSGILALVVLPVLSLAAGGVDFLDAVAVALLLADTVNVDQVVGIEGVGLVDLGSIEDDDIQTPWNHPR